LNKNSGEEFFNYFFEDLFATLLFNAMIKKQSHDEEKMQSVYIMIG
jgi:hypothetical protein